MFSSKWLFFYLYRGELIFNEMIKYVFVFYQTNTLNCNLLLLAHWKNSAQVDMSFYSDKSSWPQATSILLTPRYCVLCFKTTQSSEFCHTYNVGLVKYFSMLYRGRSIYACCQVSVHLAKRFFFFRNWPPRNKNFLWRPWLLKDGDEMKNINTGPSIDDSYQVLVHFAMRFIV